MEVILELTQEEANVIALALEAVLTKKRHLSFDNRIEQLLSDVALALLSATRDARRREVDDAYMAWANKENV